MEEVFILSKILLEIMEKKINYLEKINNITENQSSVIQSESIDFEIFGALSEQKLELTEKVNELDIQFENIYANIRPQIENNMQQIKEIYKELQINIRIVADYIIKIEINEENNRQHLQAYFSRTRKELNILSKGKTQILKSYKDNNMFSKRES